MLNFWDTPTYQGIETFPASHATTCEADMIISPPGYLYLLSAPNLCPFHGACVPPVLDRPLPALRRQTPGPSGTCTCHISSF